ncbi:hypothetical protein J5U23_02420 [Saccharolobus shibatae B12]|uniref:Uncharacterized protein n=1 Tax=Saccharolobus shibatae (strain ATCC 51178 / DSM 5389 / JCM 8931 / NBRC 15437 / B12) TaxID=523848 RepID=A0A8F5GU74_SACSH|nr:hypothetical protein [Saccharolobus shibatae]QXJ29551.1 hypothetical protein J5U23_02420 [Saccharolobus shibatae B12]
MVSKEDLQFIVSILDINDKKELVKQFSDVFRVMMEEKIISKPWYYKMMKGYAPSDDLLMRACEINDKLREFIIKKAVEKANHILEIVENG